MLAAFENMDLTFPRDMADSGAVSILQDIVDSLCTFQDLLEDMAAGRGKALVA
ncbi:conserved hypothetical protein [delta proteobacterium NaphS2]|nr:conserved hypothetical protein [delta proteobacterium NaphS2]